MRGPAVFAALLALIAAAAFAWRVLGTGDGRPVLRVSETTGEVRLERAASEDGPDALEGAVLQPDDRVATGADGRATLTLGEATTINVRSGTTVDVVDIDAAGVALELDGGALRATIPPEAPSVRVASDGREAEGREGTFEVGVQGDLMQVRSLEGEVRVAGGAGDEAILGAGEQALMVGGAAEVGPVPEDLLLSVQWPEEERTREATATIRGTTVPGSQVIGEGRFGRRQARADATGAFVLEVPLEEGANPLEVRAVDALGQEGRERSAGPVRDTRGPTMNGTVVRQAGGASP